MKYSDNKTVRGLAPLYSDELDDMVHGIENPERLDPRLMENLYRGNAENYTVLRADENTEKAIVREMKRVNSGALVGEDRREKRAQLREELSRKMWDRELRRRISGAKYGEQSRTFYSLLEQDITPEAVAANDRFARIMTSGTPEEKKREMGRKIEEIGNMDLSFVDLTDDESYVKNYDKYCQLKMWADTQNIVKYANAAGVDLTEPRYKKYCEKAAMLSILWMPLGNKEKLITNPVYDRVDMEKLTFEQARDITDSQTFGQAFIGAALAQGINTSPDGPGTLIDKSIAPQERILRVMREQNASSELYSQSAAVPDAVYEANDFRGFADSPDGFFARMNRDARTRAGKITESDFKEHGPVAIAKMVAAYRMQREYTETVRENGVPDTESFYARFNAEKINDNSELLLSTPGVKEALSELTADERELIICGDRDAVRSFEERITAAEAQAERQRRENPHDYYKAKILQNVEEIRKVDNTFTMTDEEVEAMITPEELEKHRRAAKLTDNVRRNMKTLPDDAYGIVLPSLARVAFLLEKRDGEPNAAEDNKKMLRLLAESTPEGDAFRRKTIVDILNRSNTLTGDTLRQIRDDAHRQYEEYLQQPKAPGEAVKDEKSFFDNALFDFSMQNYETAKLAIDIRKVSDDLGLSGFQMSEAGAQRLRGQHSYIVGLGSVYAESVKKYGTEDNFTFPAHKINDDLMGRIIMKGSPKIRSLSALCAERGDAEKTIKNVLAGREEERSGKKYSEEDILPKGNTDERSITSIADLRRTYAKFYKELKNADHFYNRNNSTQYTDLLASLEKADKLMKGLEGGAVPTQLRQSLFDAAQDVSEKASAYKAKKKDEEVRENRTKRIDICSRIVDYNKQVFHARESSTNPDNLYCLDMTFMSLMRTVQETADKKAQAERDEYTAERANARTDAKTAHREALFRSGLEKTEAERAKIDTFKHGTNARKAQIKAVKARDELTNLVGRKDIDTAKARALIAAVVCCDKIAKRDPNARDMNHEEIDGEIRDLYEDRNFARLTGKISSDDINAFLSENGSAVFTQKLDALRQPAQDRQRDAARQAEEPSLK